MQVETLRKLLIIYIWKKCQLITPLYDLTDVINNCDWVLLKQLFNIDSYVRVKELTIIMSSHFQNYLSISDM